MQDAAFRILADEPEFVLIDKAPGISFHSEQGEPGLFERVRQYLQLDSLYPVHRLDRITSGLLLMAKSEASNRALCTAFAEHKVEKYYLAVAKGKPSKKQGLITGDMQKSRRGQWKLLRSRNNPAATQFFSSSVGNGMRAYLLKPHTGKTHQIRVALKSLGCPIQGDELYAGEPADRGYLHAYALRFELFGNHYQFVCAPQAGECYTSDAFCQQLTQWSAPWQLNWPHKKDL